MLSHISFLVVIAKQHCSSAEFTEEQFKDYYSSSCSSLESFMLTFRSYTGTAVLLIRVTALHSL